MVNISSHFMVNFSKTLKKGEKSKLLNMIAFKFQNLPSSHNKCKVVQIALIKVDFFSPHKNRTDLTLFVKKI